MGAIYGTFGEGEPGDTERMGARLGHRGAGARWWTPARGVRFGCRFTEHEPLEQVAGERIVLDGSVDNRDEIARLLGDSRGAERGDAALVMDLYHAFGLSGLAHVDGQFALAIWDAGTERLVLARDPWSIRPLYLARAGRRWLFASEQKALLAVDDVPASPDRDAIQHLQCTRYLPRHATCLADVRPVPGGTWLELGCDGGSRAVDYRRLAVEIRDRPAREHAATLRRELLAAARRQTRRHDRVGVALSTGLDSAIALVAARHAAPEKEFHAFTARFGPDDQDLQVAADLARRFGARHHEVRLDQADLPALLPEALRRMEDPVGGEEFVVFHAVAREAAEHVTLLLTGHQSDVLFGGMPRHRLLGLVASLPVARGPLIELLNWTQSGLAPQSLLGRGLVAACAGGRRLPPADLLGASVRPAGVRLTLEEPEPLNRYMHRRLLERGDGFAAIERLHAAAGIAMASPFFGNDVVREAFRIPDRLKVRGGRQKRILRAAGRGLLPDAALRRGKSLLRVRLDRGLASVLGELAEELLADAVVRRRGLIDPACAARVRRHAERGTLDAQRFNRLWSLLLLELWCRLFLDRRGAPLHETRGADGPGPSELVASAWSLAA
ncbi:MAG TPA: asparagine synthetase B [Geminicoccaceae bacterium]|nr:asparagine synthetase B [Geminicoccaceae bacterium]